MTRTIAVAVSTTLVAGALLLLARRSNERAESTSSSPLGAVDADTRKTTFRGPAQPLRAARWRLGDQRVYVLEASRSVAMLLEGESRESFAMSLRGRWVTTVVGLDDETVDLRAEIVEPELSLAPEGMDEAKERALEAAIGRPFYMTLTRRGRIEAVHVPLENDVLAGGVSRSIAAAFQLVEPEVPANQWTTEETDATGEYEGRYTRTAVDRYRKDNLGYLRISTPAGMVAPAEIGTFTIRGGTDFGVGDDGAIAELAVDETLAVESGAGMPTIQSRSTTTARLVERRFASALVGSLAAAWESLETTYLADAAAARRAQDDRDTHTLGGADFDSLLAELGEAGAAGDGSSLADVLEKYEALFRLDGAAAGRAVAAILDAESPAVAGVLIGALGGAGTQEAQGALQSVVASDRADGDERTAAVAALGMASDPSETTIEALDELLDDGDAEVASSAALALGAIGGTLRRAGRLDESDPVDRLLELFAASRTDADRVLYLQALGNTGDLRAMPVLQTAASANASEVRGAVMAALRFMADPLADELLTAGLMSDPHPEVRRNAVFAAGFRALEPLMPALSQLVTSDAAASVRLDAVEMIGGRTAGHDAGRTLLAWVAANDPEPRVRETAAEYLN